MMDWIFSRPCWRPEPCASPLRTRSSGTPRAPSAPTTSMPRISTAVRARPPKCWISSSAGEATRAGSPGSCSGRQGPTTPRIRFTAPSSTLSSRRRDNGRPRSTLSRAVSGETGFSPWPWPIAWESPTWPFTRISAWWHSTEPGLDPLRIWRAGRSFTSPIWSPRPRVISGPGFPPSAGAADG